jgi:hypothetical protein
MENYKLNFYQNIEFTTKAHLRQINLTEEQNKMISNFIHSDDVDNLKFLINPDLNDDTSSNLNIQKPIKKVILFVFFCFFY